jgi:CheY-like chemotaxis protein
VSVDEPKSCRILAISDFDWKFSIRQRLDLGGYTNDELHFAASGLEGLAAAEQDPPDLIIYGLFTLDLDGYEFCRRLQWIPALQSVPVLLVGWISPNIVYPKAQQAGAAGYLHNTVHAQSLIVARNALLRGETYFPPEQEEPPAPDAVGDEEGSRVLVIDDNPAMGEIVHMILGRGRNDEVRYANSGPKGLAAARQNPPDLIISDIMMPGWDGFQTYHQIKMTSGLEQVPVLFQTAYARAYQTAQNLGASGCLMSPYKSQDLLDARDAALRGDTYYPMSERERG